MKFRRRREPPPIDNRFAEKRPYPQWADPSRWSYEHQDRFFRDALRDLADNGKEYVMFARFCHEQQIFREDIERWAQDVTRGQAIAAWLKKIREAEEAKIAFMGARGKINPTMAIFYLKAQYEWQDKVQTEHSGVVVMKHDLKGLDE